MRKSAETLGEVHRPTDSTFDLLMGLSSRGEVEKARMFSMLAGQATSYGNYATNELLDLWKTGGEGWDQARLDALLTTVSERYERMAENTTDKAAATVEKGAQDITSAAESMAELPANLQTAVESAIRDGMAGVTIVINEGAVDLIGNRTGSVLGQKVLDLVK